MAILGSNKLENLEFFEAHYPIWQVSPASVGLLPGQTTDLKNKTDACRAAYNGLLAAREAAKNATQVFYDKYNMMMDAGRDDLRLIKAFADSQPNPMAVYTAAQIPPPSEGPGPSPVPTAPTDFKVGLNPDGSVTLRWRAVGDGNTFWLVSRKLDGEANFSFVGGNGAKNFTDLSIPAGTTGMQYIIRGQRGDITGPESVTLGVRFGAGGGGGGGLTFGVIEDAQGGTSKAAA